MIIKKLTVGAFEVNNYLITCEKTNQSAIIDCGGDLEQLKNVIAEQGSTLKYILNTHGHLDHIAGDSETKEFFGAKIFIHKDDMPLVKSLTIQLKLYGMPHYETPSIDEFVEDGQIIELGELRIKVIHTPGHSKGGVCYLVENESSKNLFSGDTLFRESVGRTDLLGGNYKELESSVKKLLELDKNIAVHPGHGGSTTIGHEKQCNPFFN